MAGHLIHIDGLSVWVAIALWLQLQTLLQCRLRVLGRARLIHFDHTRRTTRRVSRLQAYLRLQLPSLLEVLQRQLVSLLSLPFLRIPDILPVLCA